MNNIHEYSEFKLTKEDNNITHLDLSIERNSNDLHQGFNRKLTQTGTTTHHTSNHPLEHKLAAYNFYVNSMRHYRSQNKQNNKNGTLFSL